MNRRTDGRPPHRARKKDIMSEANGTKKSNAVTWEYLLHITAAPEVLKSMMESFDARLTELGIPHTLALDSGSTENPSTAEYETLKNTSNLFVAEHADGTYAVVFPKTDTRGVTVYVDESDIIARGFPTRSAAWDYVVERFPGIPRPKPFNIVDELSKAKDGVVIIAASEARSALQDAVLHAETND
jgi:hypothetical protein